MSEVSSPPENTIWFGVKGGTCVDHEHDAKYTMEIAAFCLQHIGL